MPISVADAMLKTLADWGIKSIYGVSGDAIFPLLDAISRQNRINYYAASLETGAAFMAVAEAKLTGKPAVCVGTSGPGTANLINGLAEAFYDQVPILAITGQVPTDKIGTNAKQYFNQQQLVKNFSGKTEMIVNPKSAIPILLSSLETALNNKTVAHISVPKDVFQMPLPPDSKWPKVSGKSHLMGTGFALAIEETASFLAQAQRPVIIVGKSGREIRKYTLELAEKIGAGIIIAQKAKGVIPDDHPLVMGGIGEGYVPSSLGKADFLLLIGTASYEIKFLPANIPLYQLAEKPGDLYYDRIEQGVMGNISQMFRLLNSKIKQRKYQTSNWVGEIINEALSFNQQLAKDAQNDQVPIHPARLIAALNKTVAKDAIISLDVGSFMHWFDRGFIAQDQTVLVSSYWRSMGTGIPSAIGAKISNTNKQVLALIGDGGFLMSMGELMTAVKYRLPITIIIANNHQYGLENQKMQAQGLSAFGNDISVPDYAAYARAAGSQGYTVNEPGQLEGILYQALNSGSTTVVDVQMSDVPLPNLTLHPKTIQV